MVIGFSVTLGVILLLLGTYYLSRCLLGWRTWRRQAAAPQASAASTILEPKEVFVVVQPGGSTTMAYREGEELRGQVARDKAIPVKSVVINLAADCTAAGLIAARHPSASSAHGEAERLGGVEKPGAQPPPDAEQTLRARYGQPASPGASPRRALAQLRNPGLPGLTVSSKPLPLPLPGRPASAEAAGCPPACPDSKPTMEGVRKARLPLQPGSAGEGELQGPASAGAAQSGRPAGPGEDGG
ncbi:hypothetical protein WJX81_002231 [Elliptochloris bilobata]|uniref:Uncharacterized protein n=1 Tax=Elliptochloris bilobata TaxID=381761 RepID=A0AAW1SDY2_9CHLO